MNRNAQNGRVDEHSGPCEGQDGHDLLHEEVEVDGEGGSEDLLLVWVGWEGGVGGWVTRRGGWVSHVPGWAG